MEPIEKLDKKDFTRHDYERHLICNKVNELVGAFNKSITPQTPKVEKDEPEESEKL